MTTSSLQRNGHCEELHAKHIQVSAGFLLTSAGMKIHSCIESQYCSCALRKWSFRNDVPGLHAFCPCRVKVFEVGIFRIALVFTDKRKSKPDGGPGYGQLAECARPFCLDDLHSHDVETFLMKL